MAYPAPYYPTAIPDLTDLREVVDDVNDVLASDHNDPVKELIAIMTELGTEPKGNAASVKDRLAQSINPDGSLIPSAMWTAAPLLATDTGIPGQQAYTDGFYFICIDTDTWQQVTIATW